MKIEITCPTCGGDRIVFDYKTNKDVKCHTCNGTGKVYLESNHKKS